MKELIKIPMFPLSIFPLPGEMVPLYIFEARYRQLLQDAETKDMAFGIYFNHVSNKQQFGSLVKLESVIRRNPSGESDIIVKCVDLFEMNKLFRTYRDKLYPGGEVALANINFKAPPVNDKLLEAFLQYRRLMKVHTHLRSFSLFEIANELNLDTDQRLKFASLDDLKKESFIFSALQFQSQLLLTAEKARDVFHLN